MCGIAGIMMRDGHPAEQRVLQRLAARLKHRGPDENGFFLAGSVGLLNTRLAIIDPQGGQQPFREPGGAVLVANGEIYNDPDIRARLPDAPYQSGSDCESPLHLYRRKGMDFVDELRGMYVIAIYDPSASSLILTRDPFGIKQLYYVATPDYFAFASEPQSLLAAGLATNRLNPRKRAELMQLKFTAGDQTIFSDIQRLRPGETITVVNGRIARRRQRPALPEHMPPAVNATDALRQLGAILTDSVAVHMRSDVPYGLFLSGGIDSSVVAALMSRLSSRPIVAFTACFPGGMDEAKMAGRVARAVGAEHHVVEVTGQDFWNHAPGMAAALDDPTTDAASLPTFMLAAAAGQQLKVVLSGEGADEMLGGYWRYRRTRSLVRFLKQRTYRARGVFDPLGGQHAAFDQWRDGLGEVEANGFSPAWSPMQKLQAIDCAEYLPNELLLKFDRCLMAHSVEGRTPFLDPMVAAFAFALPDGMKVRAGLGKWLLRKWLAKHLPEAKAWARKSGFNPPIAHWMTHYKAQIAPLILSQPGIREMAIEAAVRQAFADPAKYAQAAWNLTFYGLWHSHYILGVPAEGSIGDVLSEAARSG